MAEGGGQFVKTKAVVVQPATPDSQPRILSGNPEIINWNSLSSAQNQAAYSQGLQTDQNQALALDGVPRIAVIQQAAHGQGLLAAQNQQVAHGDAQQGVLNQQAANNQGLAAGQNQAVAGGEAQQGVLNQPAVNNQAVPAGQNQQPVNNQAVPAGQNQQVEVQITTGLDNYLKAKSDGKIILKAYKDSLSKKKPLKNNIRSKLVRLVIAREKDYLLRNITEDQCLEKFVISRERFEILTKDIVTIFQNENAATYYTPFMQQDNVSILAGGKLYHHYNYVKNCLRDANILRSRRVNKQPEALHDNEIEAINDHADIVWLSNHLEPRNELINKWKSTFKERRSLLTETHLSVYDYIDKFACLKTQVAKELFFIDFNFLHPDKQFITLDRWKAIKTFLISTLDRSVTKCNDELILIELLKTGDLNSEKEDFLTLYLLCHLIKPKRSGKRKRTDKNTQPHRLSVQERRESFILRVETANDVEAGLLDLKDRYMQNHETLQPIIVAVGEASRIRNYYVAVNEKLFQVDKALEAVELALKVFFSLDCKYPNNSKTIWVFLQKILLNLDLPFDDVTVDSNILIGQIRNL